MQCIHLLVCWSLSLTDSWGVDTPRKKTFEICFKVSAVLWQCKQIAAKAAFFKMMNICKSHIRKVQQWRDGMVFNITQPSSNWDERLRTPFSSASLFYLTNDSINGAVHKLSNHGNYSNSEGSRIVVYSRTLSSGDAPDLLSFDSWQIETDEKKWKFESIIPCWDCSDLASICTKICDFHTGNWHHDLAINTLQKIHNCGKWHKKILPGTCWVSVLLLY